MFVFSELGNIGCSMNKYYDIITPISRYTIPMKITKSCNASYYPDEHNTVYYRNVEL